MQVRPAEQGDAEAIAGLVGQLGYPATTAEAAGRLAAVSRRPDHAVFAAEDGGRIVGWVHVRAAHDLERPAHAVVEGLVVDAGTRRRGVASALMQRAEDWAAAAGFPFARLYSHVDRAEAHAFYGRRGYARVATSHQFRKDL